MNTEKLQVANTLTGPAVLAAAVIAFHVVPIICGLCYDLCPVPMFFCFTPPLSSVAFVCAGVVTLYWVRKKREIPILHRKLRVTITVILGLLICDAATGGDYRWFEWSMRLQARRIQVDQFQAWTEQQINSPQQFGTWENGYFDAKSIPAALLPGVSRIDIHYRMTADGGPALQTEAGGLQSWGFIVGKSNMTKAYAQGSHGTSWSWTKQIRPGVFIYILET